MEYVGITNAVRLCPKNSQRILFIQTTVDDPNTVPHWGYFRSEPAASWIAGAITEPGWEHEIIDGDRETDPEILSRALAFNPGVIGFSCYTAGYRRALRLATAIKQHLPSVFCIFGGWHPSLTPDTVLSEQCADAVGVGQGERFINAFLRSPQSFRGMIIRAESYPPVHYTRPVRKTGDSFAQFRYFGAPPLEEQNAATILLSGPGCPFRCTYCCTPSVYGRGSGPRPIDDILVEIRDLIELHGVNYLAIRDENPPVYKQALEDLCDALIQTGLNRLVRIHSFGDTRLMTPKLLAKMAQAGWSSLNYGVDSFDQAQLRNLRRSPNLTKMETVFRWTQELGIFATANLILWQPGDTIASFRHTGEMLKWLRPDEVMPVFFVPFPGTEDFRRYDSYSKRTTRLEDYHLLTPILQLDPNVPTEALVLMRREMLNAYYSSIEYADLIDFRKRQYGDRFWSMTKLRRDSMLRYGIDIWSLPNSTKPSSLTLAASV